MRVSPTTRGYKARVYPPQKYSTALLDRENLLVTPLYDEWLLDNPDVQLDEATMKRMITLLTEAPRDRRRSFSASSAGYCMRRQELAFLGVRKIPSMDPRGVRIFNNGTFVHLRWQVGLLMAGIVDGIEVTVRDHTETVRATLDGIGVGQRGNYKGFSFGWEHKGRMSFSWRSQQEKGTPDEMTRKQVAMQFMLSGFDVWSVTNENKDTQEVTEFVIERNEEEISEVRRDVAVMTGDIEHRKLRPMLPECIKRNTTGEYYKCPFGTDAGACLNSGSWPKAV